VSYVTTACHCAVIPAEEHLDSLLKSLVKEPLGNLTTDESLNDASSTRGASSKTDGEFSVISRGTFSVVRTDHIVLQAVIFSGIVRNYCK
jgi:hypothetical protein